MGEGKPDICYYRAYMGEASPPPRSPWSNIPDDICEENEKYDFWYNTND